MVTANLKMRVIIICTSMVMFMVCINIDLQHGDQIRFSKESGFYSEEFELEILGGGQK